MIQAVMLVMLGFLLASLLGLLIAPALWSRAARLTRRRIESALPLSLNEIEAAQDRVRATYAVRLRRLETALSRAKQKAALQLVDNSRLQMQLAGLKDSLHTLETQLDERRNAANVFEQTIKQRFPELEGTAAELRAELSARALEMQDLHNKLQRRDEQLDIAQRRAQAFESEIASLREAMDRSAADRSGRRLRKPSQWSLDDYRSEYDRLNLELSKLRQQLAQAQDRESHQVALVKSELQKLSEVILLASAPAAHQDAPAIESRFPARAAPPMGFRRPIPWPAEAASSGRQGAEARPEAPAANGAAGAPSSAHAQGSARSPAGGLASPAAEAQSSVPLRAKEDATKEEAGKAADRPERRAAPLKAEPSRPLASLFGPAPAVGHDAPGDGDRTAARETSAEAMPGRNAAEKTPETGGKPGEMPPPSPEAADPLPGAAAAPASRTAGSAPPVPYRPNGRAEPDAAKRAGGEHSAPPAKPFADARDLRAISELLSLNAAPKGEEPVRPGAASAEIVREARQGVIIDGEASAEAAEAVPTAEAKAPEKPVRRSLLDRLRAVPERAEADK
jgi:hypothetical protein